MIKYIKQNNKPMSSKYSKLSDEILKKKISTMILQIKVIITFLSSGLLFDFDDENAYPTSTRDELEKTCDTISEILNSLKNHQKFVMKEAEKKQAVQKEKNDDEDEDNPYVDVKPKYEMLTSLETIKRSFFNPTNEEYISMPFSKQIMEHPFVYYRGNYKYSDDMNNKAEYIARNFNKSFVKRMEEYGKYVFAMFTCSKMEIGNNVQYKYESYMLLNSTGAFEEFIVKDNDDILFEKIDMQRFLSHFKQNDGMFDTLFVH
jgi:hypothetical protein